MFVKASMTNLGTWDFSKPLSHPGFTPHFPKTLGGIYIGIALGHDGTKGQEKTLSLLKPCGGKNLRQFGSLRLSDSEFGVPEALGGLQGVAGS